MFGIIEEIKESLVTKYLSSVVRHILTTAAGYFIISSIPAVVDLGKLIEANIGQLETILTGLATFVFTLLWSFAQKRKAK